MKIETAQTIASSVLPYVRAIDKAVAARAGDEACRSLAGSLLGYLFANLLMPVFAQFPEMQPPEFSANAEREVSARDGASSEDVECSALVSGLTKELETIKTIVQDDETIIEKNWALADLEEIFEHLDAFSMFVSGQSDGLELLSDE